MTLEFDTTHEATPRVTRPRRLTRHSSGASLATMAVLLCTIVSGWATDGPTIASIEAGDQNPVLAQNAQPAPAPPAEERNRNGYYNGSPNQLISNVWADADIRQALRDVAEQARVTIVPDSTVQGLLSLDLHNVPVEKALAIICQSGGFAYRKYPNHYVVGLANPSNPNFNALVETAQIPLQDAEADEVLAQLPAYQQQFITVDPSSNILSISAPPQILAQIAATVGVMDRAKPQVVIECLFAELNHSDGLRLDNELFVGHTRDEADHGDAVLPIGPTPRNFSDVPAENIFSYAAGAVGLGWVRNGTMVFNVIQVLKDKGLVDVRAQPRITTQSGEPADIFVGNRRYFSVLTGNVNFPTSQLEEVEAGIGLRIVPFVTPAGEILCQIEPEVSDVVGTNPDNGAPEINTRRVRTTVKVKDGGMITLGGLTQTSTRKRVSKVPLLGDLPLIGFLFRDIDNEDVEMETIIFIRPHILKPGETDWRGSEAEAEAYLPEGIRNPASNDED